MHLFGWDTSATFFSLWITSELCHRNLSSSGMTIRKLIRFTFPIILLFQIRAVKVNASSICNIPQTDVSITVEIWKRGFLGNHFVWKKTIRSLGTTNPGSKIKNFVTFRKCVDETPNYYYGVSYSKALIGGKWQYARHILSNKIIPLKCGTQDSPKLSTLKTQITCRPSKNFRRQKY